MKKRLIIIDDDVSILIAYKQLFNNETLKVDVAENIDVAESLILSKKYDAIITDLELSKDKKQEGIQLIKKVREHIKDSLIIMITAYGSDSIKQEAVSLGVCHYFEKPVSTKIIRSVLEKAGIITSKEINYAG